EEQNKEYALISSKYDVNVPPPTKYSVQLDISNIAVVLSVNLPPLYPLSQHPDVSIAVDNSAEIDVIRLNEHIGTWLRKAEQGYPMIAKILNFEIFFHSILPTHVTEQHSTDGIR
ncbi:hypothetical protein PMAYCL1PPCAC_03948, partial [Pristionchus mayeri]